jgi:hypothetical protein
LLAARESITGGSKDGARSGGQLAAGQFLQHLASRKNVTGAVEGIGA